MTARYKYPTAFVSQSSAYLEVHQGFTTVTGPSTARRKGPFVTAVISARKRGCSGQKYLSLVAD